MGFGVGLSDGGAVVGLRVGSLLKHFSVLMPKHDSPGRLQPCPVGQGSASQQFSSASWYVSPQKNLLKTGDLVGLSVTGEMGPDPH